MNRLNGKVKTASELYEIFFKLDPVVRYNENYKKEMDYNALRLAANGSWIIFGGGTDWDAYYMHNEETGELIYLGLEEFADDTLLGINRAGIWFLRYSGKDYRARYIICESLHSGTHLRFAFNKRKAEKISLPYIYDTSVFYISYVSENKQVVSALRGDDQEYALFTAKKGEYISRLSCYDNKVAFRVNSDNESSRQGWHIMDEWGQQDYNLGGAAGYVGPNNIEIHYIGLKADLMVTSITAEEAKRIGMSWEEAEKYGIRRKLSVPQQHRYLIYTKTKQPILYPEFRDFLRKQNGFFNGNVMYFPNNYWCLVRREKNGKEFRLDGEGHGETEKFVVSSYCVYVNYDAMQLVRLPWNYSSFSGPASDNPEAVSLWGGEDIRL